MGSVSNGGLIKLGKPFSSLIITATLCPKKYLPYNLILNFWMPMFEQTFTNSVRTLIIPKN
jgi:hypothetical protein